jgi:hypothetical protein
LETRRSDYFNRAEVLMLGVAAIEIHERDFDLELSGCGTKLIL